MQRLLRSDFQIRSIVVSEAHLARLPADLSQRLDVFVLPVELASELVGFKFHAGVLACVERPAKKALNDWLDQLAGHQTFIACPRLTDPENMGTMIRLAAGFGVSGLLVGEQSTDAFSRRSVRVSMGHAFALPIYQSENMLSDIRHLAEEHDFEIVSVELTDDAIPLHTFQPGQRTLLLFGNETDGLSADYLETSQQTVMIPMSGQVDSLNVANSAAIVLYHLTRPA